MSNVKLFDFLPVIDDRVVDIIFIHGLTGHPFNTWGHSGDHPTWISGWGSAIADACPRANAFSVCYDASAFVKPFNRRLTLKESAADARLSLINHGIGGRPIIFVCHSMGGILLKQILRKDDISSNNNRKIFDSVKHVIFIGTPHKGSKWANRIRFLFWPFSSKNIDALAYYSEYLEDLHEWYVAKCSTKFNTINFFEKRRSFLFFDVVSREGLDFVASGVDSQPLYENHISICKANSEQNPAVETLSRLISDIGGKKDGNEIQSPIVGKIKSRYSFIYHAIDGAKNTNQIKSLIDYIEKCKTTANEEQNEELHRALNRVSAVTQQAFQEDPNFLRALPTRKASEYP